MKTWKVSERESGIKLVVFLRTKFGDLYSSRKLKQAIESNHCKLNGHVEKFASCVLNPGDRVSFDDEAPSAVASKSYQLEKSRILYEDESLVFYNKPAGMTSDSKGLMALFSNYQLVHRLDRDTTGVILIAKSEEIFKLMVHLFKTMQVKKKYLALVDGIFQKSSGIIENFLGNISKNKDIIQWGPVPRMKGKHAKTSWELLEQGTKAALVHCYPHTGRTHQLRIHMKGIGHPILGDYQYSRKYHCPYPAKRCMLHASELSFCHPVTGGLLRVEAPLPQDFLLASQEILK